MRACFGLSEEQVSNQHDTVVKTFLKNHWHIIDEDGDNRNELKLFKVIKSKEVLWNSKELLIFGNLESFSCDWVNRRNFNSKIQRNFLPHPLYQMRLALDSMHQLYNFPNQLFELYNFKPRKYKFHFIGLRLYIARIISDIWLSTQLDGLKRFYF